MRGDRDIGFVDLKTTEGLLILVSSHRAMEEEIHRGEECLSPFTGIPCDTIFNLNSVQNLYKISWSG
jgi:hypothetical protein